MSRYIVDSKKDLLAYEQLIWTPLRCLEDADKAIDDAYQRGVEDGKKSKEKGCDGCKYYEDTSLTNPCSECSRGHVDHYKPVSDSDRIEVGDEVIWTTDNITLIVTSIYKVGSINWCDGVAKDGKVYSTLIENDRKTGKHYDIQSILDAMKQ